MRGLAEGYLKAQMPREHNRLYNSTSYATTIQKRSGLRHERRNVPLAAVSAGTVKRLGIGRWDGARTEVDEGRVRAKVSTVGSNRLERRAHNLMNSEPRRQGARL